MTEPHQLGGERPHDPSTSTPRWERESQEDLRPTESESESEPQPSSDKSPPRSDDPESELQPTSELEYPFDYDQDDERWPEREPRLAAARESLSATRESFGESLSATRESLSATASKVGHWLHSLDRRPEFHSGRDPVAELTSGGTPESGDDRERDRSARGAPGARGHERPGSERAEHGSPAPERAEHERPAPERADDTDADGIEIGVRFPTAPLGYNRQAVDSHIALLEAEIAELREQAAPPLSIEEEIERLGEQTASILVVAHDKAYETARRAQQQAARAVREAAADAERITAAAEQRLRELDEETDAVWRERERLLEDVREVSRTLVTLADAASERFPAAPEPMAPVAAAAHEARR
jgi:hypothetical protein